MTSSKWAEDRDNLWHDHAWYNNEMSKLSGVFYVHLTSRKHRRQRVWYRICTEGLSGTKFYCPHVGQWAVYPASWLHRPGILKKVKKKDLSAADLGWKMQHSIEELIRRINAMHDLAVQAHRVRNEFSPDSNKQYDKQTCTLSY